MHNLNTLSNTTGHSIAHDVNASGQIAGQRQVTIGAGNHDHAHVWQLDDGDAIAVDLGVLHGSSSSTASSHAYGISESDPAIVVGVSEIAPGACEEPDPPPVCESFTCLNTFDFGFRRELSVSGTMEQLTPPAALAGDPNVGTHARAVSANGVIVGSARECSSSAGCASDHGGGQWTDAKTGVELVSLAQTSGVLGSLGRHLVLGVNAGGNMVGAGHCSPGPSGQLNCLQHAPFWEDDGATPVNLGIVDPIDGDEEATFANAITNVDACDRLQVVGQNLGTNTAWLWVRDDQLDWTSVDLNDLIPSAPAWSALIEATDINGGGLIVGWGVRNSQNRVFLLVPIQTCWADLNGDCKVNGQDIAVMLGYWSSPRGARCTPVTCWADFTEDGQVNGLDLAYLLGMWGPCPER